MGKVVHKPRVLCDLLQLQHAQLHTAILSRDKVERQNRAIKSQV